MPTNQFAIKICIIEGPDGAGKTTLAKRIAEKSGLPYVHMGPPDPADPDLILAYRDRLVEGGVIDRLALSERIYGPLLRGEDRIGDRGWDEIQNHMVAAGAVQVLCLPPPDACLKAWRSERAQLFRSDAAFWETYARYSWWSRRIPGMIVYDWTSKWAEEREEWILKKLGAR